MLPLDSPRWPELTHAYGTASDTPALLKQLQNAQAGTHYTDEPWYSLWSSLCHQNDVFTASYAALPHILGAASGQQAGQRIRCLLLAACIEAMRHTERAPKIPTDLVDSYREAIQAGLQLATRCAQESGDEEATRVALGSLAVFRGHYKIGMAIFDLEEMEDCPNCEKPFTTRGYDLF